jgi:hypothetical protein
MRRTLYFIPPFPHRVRGSGSDMPFFGLLSRGHGKRSTSPAPWRHIALLLPLRGPPGFRFLPKRFGFAEQHLFQFLRKLQSLAGGAGATCL